jgi:hypothetical protein
VIGQVSTTESGDDDVDNERNRVINGGADSECLRLVNLTKVRNVTLVGVHITNSIFISGLVNN